MKKTYEAEQIIRVLRQCDVMLAQEKSIAEVCRELGISDATYYKWRKAYGGMKANQAKRLNELERENIWVKRVIAIPTYGQKNCRKTLIYKPKIEDEVAFREALIRLASHPTSHLKIYLCSAPRIKIL